MTNKNDYFNQKLFFCSFFFLVPKYVFCMSLNKFPIVKFRQSVPSVLLSDHTIHLAVHCFPPNPICHGIFCFTFPRKTNITHSLCYFPGISSTHGVTPRKYAAEARLRGLFY